MAPRSCENWCGATWASVCFSCASLMPTRMDLPVTGEVAQPERLAAPAPSSHSAWRRVMRLRSRLSARSSKKLMAFARRRTWEDSTGVEIGGGLVGATQVAIWRRSADERWWVWRRCNRDLRRSYRKSAQRERHAGAAQAANGER